MDTIEKKELENNEFFKVGTQVFIKGIDFPISIKEQSVLDNGIHYDYRGSYKKHGRKIKIFFNHEDIIVENRDRVLMGTIIGDLVGSVYEHNPIKTKTFGFLKTSCCFTDDTVMTCAVALASIDYASNKNIDDFKKKVIFYLKKIGRSFPDAGYGHYFLEWLESDSVLPYNSYGNGSAMRTASVAYIAESLDEALLLAKVQSEVTHNHPEAIKGAQAIAACIYLALNGYDKIDIRTYIEEKFYPLDFRIDEIYKKYKFDVSAAGSVPQAIVAFLDGNDFEDCIRNAISLGGDADTLAAMTGSIAEAYYGIPKNIAIDRYLNNDLINIINMFNNYLIKNRGNVFEKREENKNIHCNEDKQESQSIKIG